MFVVGNILISDDLLDAPFACNLGACHGACCVVGDAGAPLEADEREQLEKALPAVRSRLRPEARAVIDRRGVWEKSAAGEYTTTCVGDAECVFVIYNGPVAKCSLQQAFHEGRIDFEKPISCHLYPVRVEDLGEYEALNYERAPICSTGVKRGRREAIPLTAFLRDPLVRRYGADWYEEFVDACRTRRELLADTF